MKKNPKAIFPSEEEEAQINRGIELDPDNPEWTDEDFARGRPAREALPEILGQENAEKLLNKNPGRRRKENPKERIIIHLDADLVKWIKDQGPGYQSRVNAILRNAMENH